MENMSNEESTDSLTRVILMYKLNNYCMVNFQKWKTCQRKNPPIAFHIYRTRYSDLMHTRVSLQQPPNVFPEQTSHSRYMNTS